MPVNTRSKASQNSIIEEKNANTIDVIATTNNSATDCINDSAILISNAIYNINKMAELINCIKQDYQDILTSKTLDFAIIAAKNSAANYATLSITEQTARLFINAASQSLEVSIESYNAVKTMVSMYKTNFTHPYSIDQTTLINKIIKAMEEVIQILLQTAKDAHDSVQILLNNVQNAKSNSIQEREDIKNILQTHVTLNKSITNSDELSTKKIKDELDDMYTLFIEKINEQTFIPYMQENFNDKLKTLEDEVFSIVEYLPSKINIRTDINTHTAKAEELLSSIKKNHIISTNEDKLSVRKIYEESIKNVKSIKTLAGTILENVKTYDNAYSNCLDSLSLIMRIRNSYSEILSKEIQNLSRPYNDRSIDLIKETSTIVEIFEKYSSDSSGNILKEEVDDDKKTIIAFQIETFEKYDLVYSDFSSVVGLLEYIKQQFECIKKHWNWYESAKDALILVKPNDNTFYISYIKAVQARIKITYPDAQFTMYANKLGVLSIIILVGIITVHMYSSDSTPEEENLIGILKSANKLIDDLPSLIDFNKVYNAVVLEIDESATISILEKKLREMLDSLTQIDTNYISHYDNCFNNLANLLENTIVEFETILDGVSFESGEMIDIIDIDGTTYENI